MNRRRVVIGLVATAVGVGVAAAEVGFVGDTALSHPIWLAFAGFVVGYWAVFLHWARG